MVNENNGRRRVVSRQNWKPSRSLRFLRGAWTLIYSLLKLVLAALATVLAVAGVCIVVFVGILGDYLQKDILPNTDAELDNILLDQTSFVYYVDSHGNIQQLQQLYADVKQEWVDYEDIPKDLINATVAIEDKRFFEHQGVDWFTTVKACVGMFMNSADAGGSTITQQLIKNYFQADEVTVQRKVQEIFRATELEKRYDKEVILEYYLNIIYLGERCNGIKAAAATYFGKELEHLTPAECASLISITNNPSLFNPYRTTLDKWGKTGMEQNLKRRTDTLWMMRNEGYLTEEVYRAALDEPLTLKRGIDEGDKVFDCEVETCGYHGKVSTFVKKDDGRYYCPQCDTVTKIGENASQEVYSYFVDTVLKDVARDLAEKNGAEWNEDTEELYLELISRSGYHIYTTLDMDVQNQVDKIYQNPDEIPPDVSLQPLQSGMVIIDNRTGDIIAMAGGVGEKDTHFGFNRATKAKLQPGSSFKPLTVYAPAFQLEAITPASIVRDMPNQYLDGRPWPYNDNRQYSYSRTILGAVVNSVNAAAVDALDSLGTGYSFNFVTEKFGISTLVKQYIDANGKTFSDEGLSPLALGAPTFGVTVREMAEAYATFANGGVYREARTYTKVYNSKGEVVLSNEQDTREILSEKAVNYMNYCLDQAVQFGTGGGANLGSIAADGKEVDVAGKTGSTASFRDRWFCGFTNYYTAATWCGYDIPEVINMINGGNPACQLFKKVMSPLHAGRPTAPLYDSEDMIEVRVCMDCGKLATDACQLDTRGNRVSPNAYHSYNSGILVYEEDAPLEECDCHVVMEFCEECDAVANEYCKKLAEVGKATIVEKAVVKMTAAQVTSIANATGKGLIEQYIKDNCVLLVDRNGDPVEDYKGIQGDLNKKVDAAYLVCTEHTKKDWDKYLKDHPDHNISTDQDKEEEEDKDNTVTPGGEDTPEEDQEET